jgi:hypothetical protein
MPQIVLQPDPPVHGQSCLICVDEATMPLTLDITPAGGGTIKLKITKYCEYFTIPDGWKGVMVNFHDESGQAPDVSRLVA